MRAYRHRLAMLGTAMGLSREEVARQTGYRPGTLKSLQGQPGFRQGVEALQQQLQTAVIDDFVARLSAESAASLTRVIQLRDGANRDSIKLQAALALIDRTPGLAELKRPEQQAGASVHITIGAEALARLKAVVAEAPDALVPAAG